MKNLSHLISKNQYVITKDLDIDIQEKFQNIDGQLINECCCSCCNKCIDKCSFDATIGEPTLVWFYSESEIVRILKTNATVQTLFNLHNQFGKRFNFGSNVPGDVINPLYFKEIVNPTDNTMAELQANMYNAQYNENVFEYIAELCQKYKLTYPVVLSKINNTVQLFFIKGTGTNGREGSIKNSLLEIYKLLCELSNADEIENSQVLDVSIDNCDDVYTFLITCTLDIKHFI